MPTLDFLIDEKPWEATWPRGEPPSELESGGNIYLDKEGRRKQCKARKPREGVVMSGPGPGNAPSKSIPSRHIWKGKSHFQKPGPGRKKKVIHSLMACGILLMIYWTSPQSRITQITQ